MALSTFTLLLNHTTSCLQNLPYFSDYKTHHPPNLRGNGGASYSPNVAYMAFVGEGAAVEQGCFSYFPPLKPRCVL